jgi:hypothetical protein
MREIGFLSRDGGTVSHACRTSRGSTHPMKERAIVIFEFEEKEGTKKEKLGQRLWNGLDCQARRGADAVFSSSDNTWVMRSAYHLQQRVSNIGIIF